MNNNVAGIHVPDEMIEELKADKEKTKAGITGVEIAARIIKECKPYCQGVHIMALGWESKIPALLEQAGNLIPGFIKELSESRTALFSKRLKFL